MTCCAPRSQAPAWEREVTEAPASDTRRGGSFVRRPFQVVAQSPADDGPEGPSYLRRPITHLVPWLPPGNARSRRLPPPTRGDRIVCTTSFPGRRAEPSGRRPGRAIVPAKANHAPRSQAPAWEREVTEAPASDTRRPDRLYDVLSRSSRRAQRTTARKGHRTCEGQSRTSFPGSRMGTRGHRGSRLRHEATGSFVRRPFQVVAQSPTDDGAEGPSYLRNGSTLGCHYWGRLRRSSPTTIAVPLWIDWGATR
ncbi:hypothetical protein Enr13x_59150 [Stieleria neptunia]|uniref:Uncharacterized protein n=1 Tax=Stieleria neptunia TaxID=2527979 RepID=A0A518HYS6_9BACT|nr:hypothetical protein Enr13x_59150 [Stieleria neptunia]